MHRSGDNLLFIYQGRVRRNDLLPAGARAIVTQRSRLLSSLPLVFWWPRSER